jgi:Cys-rich four helix bundle protein (predicted Tat secretion target)
VISGFGHEEITMSDREQSGSAPAQPRTHEALSRRDVLFGAGAVASLAVAGAAFAADDKDSHHEHHYTTGTANKKHPALVAAAYDCIAKGEACLSHCLETFRAGDTTMADCASSVEQMIPVCQALAHLAVRDSKHLPALARACVAVCEDCEKQCREHAEHQEECKAAADACAKLVKEAKLVAA